MYTLSMLIQVITFKSLGFYLGWSLFHSRALQFKLVLKSSVQLFSSLKRLKEEASLSIGYLIALGKKYREVGVFQVDDMERRLAELLPNCGGRTVKGYANLVWFTLQVCTFTYILHIRLWLAWYDYPSFTL